jgi:hypothetical protein
LHSTTFDHRPATLPRSFSSSQLIGVINNSSRTTENSSGPMSR